MMHQDRLQPSNLRSNTYRSLPGNQDIFSLLFHVFYILNDFVASPAVLLWWKDCRTTRRVNQQLPRKDYPSCERNLTAREPETDSEDVTFSLKE